MEYPESDGGVVTPAGRSGKLARMEGAHYRCSALRAPVARPSALSIAAGLLAAMFLSACASSGANVDNAGHRAVLSAPAALSNDVLMRAIGLVGTPYRYGGNTPAGGFDCSGLVNFVFVDAAGVKLPRSTGELIRMQAPEVDRGDLEPGDLVFFNPGGGSTSHIGIYVGEDRFVHAPSSGGTVRLDVLGSSYWRNAYQGAKRVLR